jgi:hypothetical protein
MKIYSKYDKSGIEKYATQGKTTTDVVLISPNITCTVTKGMLNMPT